MSELSLDLHQVLEEEYVSMYGPLDRPPATYEPGDVLDPVWARAVLYECGIEVASTPETVATLLTKYVEETDRDHAVDTFAKLKESRAITDRGRHLIQNYDEYRNAAEESDGAVGIQELHRVIVDEALCGAVRRLRDTRLDKVYAAIHERAKHGKPRTALCLSGGGIRSATFALGVIQGLAAAGKLHKFEYLSTVSGGGYIGSWLSSWMRRHPRGATGVQDDLVRADTAIGHSTSGEMVLPTAGKTLPEHKINPEPPPLRHLRAYSNYLSPKLGLFSGDTWTMASLYIRNLLLNLLVLVPLLAVALAFPRIFSLVLEFSKNIDQRSFHPTGWALVAAWFTTLGFAYLGYKRPVTQGERLQKKAFAITSDGRILAFCVLPLMIAATALAVFWARVQQHPEATLLEHPTTESAVKIALLGMTVVPWLLYYGRFWLSSPAERRTRAGGVLRLVKKQLAEGFAVVAALATTSALLLLIAEKVFYDPVRPVPTTALLEPLMRIGQTTAPHAQIYASFAVPLMLLVFFVQASVFVGLSSLFNEDSDREWWGRAGGWLLLTAVVLGVFNAIAVFGPIAFYYAPVLIASAGGAAGVAAALLGFSDKTPANQKEKEEGGKVAKVGNVASALVVPIFVVALLAGISLGTTWLIQHIDEDHLKSRGVITPAATAEKKLFTAQYTQSRPVEGTPYTANLETAKLPMVNGPALAATAHLQTIQSSSLPQMLIIVAVGGLALLLSRFIGVNKFSMHALYRNRLIRAYLGASRYDRDPDRFTGFDENDNLQMWQLRPELFWAWSFTDVKGFVIAMQKGKVAARPWYAALFPKKGGVKEAVPPGTSLPEWLWSSEDVLSSDTRKTLADPEYINGVALDALVSDLNYLVTDDDLEQRGFAVPAWAQAARGTISYSRAIRNRAILDDALGAWIRPMTPPADAREMLAKRLGKEKPEDAPAVPHPGCHRPPLHIVNTALNLTSGDNLAWQQRMAASFSVSPYHSGSLFLGYRSSKQYGGDAGISLGSAVTISGAAASPNMGYHSSPLMAFLLTFFNIRLGAWLGNPGPHGRKSYRKGHPSSGILQLFAELTGNSNARSKWVYLSDGGHFENLALYEMVLRRCHTIVVSDAGADPTYTFDDLGNAIRKIRTDLGVPIDIDKTCAAPRGKSGEPVDGRYIAIGTIRYNAVDANAENGTLIYIKPGIFKDPDVPVDVYNYAQQSHTFPHESTGDQFFSESQFESYRALGRHAFEQLWGQAGAAAAARLPIRKEKLDEMFGEKAQAPQVPRQLYPGTSAPDTAGQ